VVGDVSRLFGVYEIPKERASLASLFCFIAAIPCLAEISVGYLSKGSVLNVKDSLELKKASE